MSRSTYYLESCYCFVDIYIIILVFLEETVTDMNTRMKAYNKCVNKIRCVYLQYKLLFL